MSKAIETIDPFFELVPDSTWNALIGRQGEEYHYIDGYIEAALELAESIISKKLWAQRDTLVLPILFNARHSLELLLKATCNQLAVFGVLKRHLRINHDIKEYWTTLHDVNFGDLQFRNLLSAFAPFVESLSRIDSDGQSFRYFENRDGSRSMQEISVINIRLVAWSLRRLKALIDEFQQCVRRLERERPFGYHTSRCSRQDLLTIAERLPDREKWKDAEFRNIKQTIRDEFGLSNNAFSDALNVIQSHRLMKLKIGIYTPLFSISDQNIILFATTWRTLHSDDAVSMGITFPDDMLEEGFFDEMVNYGNATMLAINALDELLAPKEVWDISEIFQVGRNNELVEFYDHQVKEVGNCIDDSYDKLDTIRYLLEKTNLQQSLIQGLSELGRPDLADQLRSI